jgi:CRISP-associated protein Cas1
VLDLHALPRFNDGWSFLYVEKVRIEQDGNAIMLLDARGSVPVPVAALAVLMLGPGSTITHAAMLALGDNGCSVVWCGEGAVRFYAAGGGETRKSANLLVQAEAWADPAMRLEVVKRLYRMRFNESPRPDITIDQLRGMEGVRVRETYARLARETGIEWRGRAYKRGDWAGADPVNRALSTANACLYGLVHAAIVSTGFSPALGFIHTGKALSFVYDIADLYKSDTTVPIAFEAARDDWNTGFEGRVRRMCRYAFWERKLLERMIPDIQTALGLRPEQVHTYTHAAPVDATDDEVGELWDPNTGSVTGGQNWGDRLPAQAAGGARRGDPAPLEEERDDEEDLPDGSGTDGKLPF